MSPEEQTLESEFLRIGSQWSAATHRRNPKRANTLYHRLYDIIRAMRCLPDRGEAALKRITTASDPEVRTLAAAGILALDEPYALGILEDVAGEGLRLVSFTAQMTIREWRAGSIREYWS